MSSEPIGRADPPEEAEIFPRGQQTVVIGGDGGRRLVQHRAESARTTIRNATPEYRTVYTAAREAGPPSPPKQKVVRVTGRQVMTRGSSEDDPLIRRGQSRLARLLGREGCDFGLVREV